MLGKKLHAALNEQFNREYYSSYLYLAMAAYATSINLDGFASWLRVQANEEMEHAMKFFDYIHDRQGKAELEAISRPPAKYKNILDLFEKVVAHETHITGSIYALCELAEKEKDYATQAFLQWFVTEQVEEEANAQRVFDRLKMAGDSTGALLYFDKEMGKRAKAA